ncbi:uncharacterized protein MONOS_6558 [Monocercomonoides exilis]|uniref:uncharacterized protein n=1 Tax=Monocercomonoides exilis TaxID=2049356 RepID=UPI003559A92F|nr:hypothetical protein MONOS_6558 [Monocercomonoides exilis]|eukprot:MONOS_6558.1-p1 / transcript=MONOS_6558.1 / gene=MONOS_6558 / organism=Monocercomonoides_exilis_PA203 / gene_product=unspecified product / transcript_product=unspecified product / location=Mono_scaffold00208:48022-50201(+) / protein_length=701 / sequence_SO=supercontig / SO=protein_coding / is_pseudo=false
MAQTSRTSIVTAETYSSISTPPPSPPATPPFHEIPEPESKRVFTSPFRMKQLSEKEDRKLSGNKDRDYLSIAKKDDEFLRKISKHKKAKIHSRSFSFSPSKQTEFHKYCHVSPKYLYTPQPPERKSSHICLRSDGLIPWIPTGNGKKKGVNDDLAELSFVSVDDGSSFEVERRSKENRRNRISSRLGATHCSWCREIENEVRENETATKEREEVKKKVAMMKSRFPPGFFAERAALRVQHQAMLKQLALKEEAKRLESLTRQKTQLIREKRDEKHSQSFIVENRWKKKMRAEDNNPCSYYDSLVRDDLPERNASYHFLEFPMICTATNMEQRSIPSRCSTIDHDYRSSTHPSPSNVQRENSSNNERNVNHDGYHHSKHHHSHHPHHRHHHCHCQHHQHLSDSRSEQEGKPSFEKKMSPMAAKHISNQHHSISPERVSGSQPRSRPQTQSQSQSRSRIYSQSPNRHSQKESESPSISPPRASPKLSAQRKRKGLKLSKTTTQKPDLQKKSVVQTSYSKNEQTQKTQNCDYELKDKRIDMGNVRGGEGISADMMGGEGTRRVVHITDKMVINPELQKTKEEEAEKKRNATQDDQWADEFPAAENILSPSSFPPNRFSSVPTYLYVTAQPQSHSLSPATSITFASESQNGSSSSSSSSFPSSSSASSSSSSSSSSFSSSSHQSSDPSSYSSSSSYTTLLASLL